MRLLFVVQHFHQGWGGAPESVRLTAQRLAAYGIFSDVVDRGHLHRDIATLPYLPSEADQPYDFDHGMVSGYDAVLITGPWQSYRSTRRIIDQMSHGQKLFYLPRGGLADIEFRRGKWLKKNIYLKLFETYFLKRADHIIWSSRLEADHSSRMIAFSSKGAVIPDHFAASTGQVGTAANATLTLAFMAEIGFRKGLLPFIRGLLAWHDNRDDVAPIKAIIAGGTRPDALAYLCEARALAAQAKSGLDISFVGPIAHEDRAAFYAGCDLFIVPSLFESFCLTALEALTAGCSIIVSPNLGVLEQLPLDPSITVLDSIEPSAFAEGLDRAFGGNRDHTHSMACAAIDRSNTMADRCWIELLA